MNGFLKKVLMFSISILIVNTFLFTIVRKYYFEEYENFQRGYQCYLLADSHGDHLGQRTEYYGVSNFSAGSDSYLDMYRKTQYLIRNTDVDKIIISMDGQTISKYRESLNNADRSVIYSRSGDHDSFYKYIINRYIRRYFVFSSAKSRDIIRLFLVSEMLGINSWNETDSSWNELSLRQQIRIAEYRALDQFPSMEVSRKMLSHLERIILICKENDIELVGIRFPLSKVYLNVVSEKIYGIEGHLNNLGIPVYDFKDLYLDKDDFFMNPDHLNQSGSEDFVRVLSELVF